MNKQIFLLEKSLNICYFLSNLNIKLDFHFTKMEKSCIIICENYNFLPLQILHYLLNLKVLSLGVDFWN